MNVDVGNLLKIFNSLLLIAFLFTFVSTFGNSNPTGNFFEQNIEPRCEYIKNNYSSNVPIGRCCLMAERKIQCVEGKNGKYCSDDSDKGYRLNKEAVNYCNQKGFNIE